MKRKNKIKEAPGIQCRFNAKEIEERAHKMSDIEGVAWLALILGNEMDYRYIKKADIQLTEAYPIDAPKSADEFEEDEYRVDKFGNYLYNQPKVKPICNEDYESQIEKLGIRIGIAKVEFGGLSKVVTDVEAAQAALAEDEDAHIDNDYEEEQEEEVKDAKFARNWNYQWVNQEEE